MDKVLTFFRPSFLKRQSTFISDINEDDNTKKQKLEDLKKDLEESSINQNTSSELVRINLRIQKEKEELAEEQYAEMIKELGVESLLDKSLLKTGDLIASGSQGKVENGTLNGFKVAIKSPSQAHYLHSVSLYEEARILAKLKGSDYICNLQGFVTLSTDPYKELRLVMDLYECSLHDAIHGLKHKREFTAVETINLILDIFLGIAHIHKMGIMHRDIKPGNILLKIQNGKVIPFLCDFGFARQQKFIEEDIQPIHQMIENIGSLGSSFKVGTVRYSAPEIFKKIKYDQKIDIYSAAVVMWEIVHRKFPFSTFSPDQIAQKVGVNGFRETIQITDPALKFLEILIRECWNQNPTKRPDAREAVEYILLNTLPKP